LEICIEIAKIYIEEEASIHFHVVDSASSTESFALSIVLSSHPMESPMESPLESPLETANIEHHEEVLVSTGENTAPLPEITIPSVENGEGSANTPRKRYRGRDDLNLSPDASKVGKRQRKANSLFSEFVVDKKSSHVPPQEENSIPITPVTEEIPPVGEVGVNSAMSAADQAHLKNHREIIVSTVEAKERNKNLPKGYSYEPIVPRQQKDVSPLPIKRERKRSSFSDFVANQDKPEKKQKKQKRRNTRNTKK